MQAFSISGILLTVLIVSSLSLSEAWSIDLDVSCNTPGTWVIPDDPDLFPVKHSSVISSTEDMDFILLGEQHDSAPHHRWQTQMLSALLSHKDHIAIGLEMLPRASQPTLDAWVNGELTYRENLYRKYLRMGGMQIAQRRIEASQSPLLPLQGIAQHLQTFFTNMRAVMKNNWITS